MLHDVTCISREALVGEIAKIKLQGYRFVTLSCVERDERAFDIFFHFDKDLKLKHFKLSVSGTETVPSITAVYSAAFLVENEIQDLFGITFDGLVVDYERTFYLEAEVNATPFCRYTAIQEPHIEQTMNRPSVET
jgi:ech hydrogenase subunit D